MTSIRPDDLVAVPVGQEIAGRVYLKVLGAHHLEARGEPAGALGQ